MRFNRRFKQGRSICLSDASSLWQMVSDLKSLNFKPKLLGKLNRCLRPFARFEQITHGAKNKSRMGPTRRPFGLRCALQSIVMRWAGSFFYQRATPLKSFFVGTY